MYKKEIEKLKKKIEEIENLKIRPAWGAEYRLWLDLTKKLVKEIFGDRGLNLFNQNNSVVINDEAYVRELNSRKVTLEGLLNNKDEYQPENNDPINGGKNSQPKKGPYPGVFIAARKIINNGEISSEGPNYRTELITEDYSGHGKVNSKNTSRSSEKWYQKWWGQILIGVVVLILGTILLKIFHII